ncbi:hypothetical protein K488DRAFT_91014 [Vararia minispora EC-137]|uniref:Uncharacterized protein n=1 Tax=Vararia minispora EC-137 TaxID=1314806 RepID=A0ACB8Q696_9AGAM|nr:hypothetical protein K488DRAFT_91014 [Vararia minispora EC-137]
MTTVPLLIRRGRRATISLNFSQAAINEENDDLTPPRPSSPALGVRKRPSHLVPTHLVANRPAPRAPSSPLAPRPALRRTQSMLLLQEFPTPPSLDPFPTMDMVKYAPAAPTPSPLNSRELVTENQASSSIASPFSGLMDSEDVLLALPPDLLPQRQKHLRPQPPVRRGRTVCMPYRHSPLRYSLAEEDVAKGTDLYQHNGWLFSLVNGSITPVDDRDMSLDPVAEDSDGSEEDSYEEDPFIYDSILGL